MLDSMFGTDGVPTTTAIIVAALVLLVIVLIVWAIRRRGPMTFLKGGHGRQPRLAVLDATQVDSKRRLVLVRRDHIEHLIMIGGPTDVVIESRIIRSDGTRFAKPAPSAPASPAKVPPPTEDKAPPPAVPDSVPMPPPPAPKPAEKPKSQPVANAEPAMAPVRKSGYAMTASSVPPQRPETPKPVAASVTSATPHVRPPAPTPTTGEGSERPEPTAVSGGKPAQPAAPPMNAAGFGLAAAATAPVVPSPADSSTVSETSGESTTAEAVDEKTPSKPAGDSSQPEPSTPASDQKASDPDMPEVIPMPAPAVETEDIAEEVEEVPTLSKAKELIGEFDQLLESELNKEDEAKETGQESPSPETAEAEAAEEPSETTEASQPDDELQQVKQASLEDEMKKLLGDLSTRR